SITLEVGQRVSEGYPLYQNNPYLYEEEMLTDKKGRTYTIVGIIERPNYNVEDRIAPGYSAFTCLEDPMTADKLNIYVGYTDWGIRHASQVTEGLKELAEEVEDNYYLLKWLQFTFSSATMEMIYAMAAVAMIVIIVTSVFCIRNSFTISLTEKMKLYGRLASVGTTSKQQRKIVYYEAAFLGMVGIPLGILSGILASVILVQSVSGLMDQAIDIPLVFGISWPAVILSALLASVTIFFSSWQSARCAAKISPISAIRANTTVKIRRRELRCPRWIPMLLGIGGKVAYKNLRRARVKYRTTVISIVVGVAVFIGLTTFMHAVQFTSNMYYKNRDYQLRITSSDTGSYEKLLAVAQLEGVEAAEIVRFGHFHVPLQSLPLTEDYLNAFYSERKTEEYIWVYSLGEDAYARYCSRVGIPIDEDRAIVLAEYETITYDEKGRMHEESGDSAHFRQGDVIVGSGEEEVSVTVAVQTDVKPISMSDRIVNGIVLFVSDRWMDSHWEELKRDNERTNAYIKCESANQIEEAVRQSGNFLNYTIANYEKQYQSEKSTQLLISIFLYGFITVVSLIGITNIFNTITTNMELRAPEFAMLRAVGMTGREFQRMIWLESMFYGGKALLIGIPLGVGISCCFHLALNQGIETDYLFPWSGICISIVAVVLLLYGTMHYSMGKIKKKNIVETIQNENL
ncbi:MAG: ABC transporter permease, partial [Acetatifactor sp.]|nr:ABC transporter permease [Acetatifactor sp.]